MNKNSFTHSSKLLFILSLLWAVVLLLIGSWWVYFMINFEKFLSNTDRSQLTKMLAWEGGSFIVLLMLLSVSIFILYLKDQGKTKSLQAFFASLTHELKTPLASIRLQSEVINEKLQEKKDPALSTLLGRLIEDTAKLETQMDKILQLSRLERGGELNLTPLSLIPLVKRLAKVWVPEHQVEILAPEQELLIEADEFALELIFKNLLENTRQHTSSKKIQIAAFKKGPSVLLTYHDHGRFSGDLNKLGTLFYKHNSSKGSGIGLYLSQRLVEKMHGRFLIEKVQEGLEFKLIFPCREDKYA